METKALKAKRPGFTDERYNETSYYTEHGNLRRFQVETFKNRSIIDISSMFIKVAVTRYFLKMMMQAETEIFDVKKVKKKSKSCARQSGRRISYLKKFLWWKLFEVA